MGTDISEEAAATISRVSSTQKSKVADSSVTLYPHNKFALHCILEDHDPYGLCQSSFTRKHSKFFVMDGKNFEIYRKFYTSLYKSLFFKTDGNKKLKLSIAVRIQHYYNVLSHICK